ncbi:MAG: Acyltransferase [Pseudonocardiales bacterium]|nr:Acyltransferase [Pseudonocardiales bacterium]
MDRMSSLDAGFWHLESPHASMHIASVSVFAGPAPSHADLVQLFRHKLHLVPRYRQKMRTVPLGLARPGWVDDAHFDLSYHVRCTALPAPGTAEQLRRLVGRLMSQHLDPDRPLWETWLVEGLEDRQWALVSKVHHSMVDGIAGMDVLSTILDTSADPILPPVATWAPQPEPGLVALAGAALLDAGATPVRLVRGLGSATRRPQRTARLLATGLRGLIGYARAVRPTAATSLTGSIGRSRRYRWFGIEIADVARVREALGGSLNDVVLAIVTRGFRELLLHRAEEPVPQAVRCLVPVSVRKSDEHGRCDNRVSALLVDLPVEFADPVAGYGAVVTRMRELKSSDEAAAGELITELADQVPPAVLAATLRAAFRVPQRTLTTVATNVPGPRQPLYVLGHRMLAIYPYVPIADQLRIGVAVTSYDGRLFFGVTCDRDSVPDVDVLTAAIEDGLAELLKAAVTTEQESR